MEPPPRPTMIRSTSGSASAIATPRAITGPAVVPCTGTLNTLNVTNGLRWDATCKIS